MRAVASGHPAVMLYHGDCREVLAALPADSIDAIVTDPPYELGFMGRAWDASGIAYSVDLWRECLRVLKPGGHLLAFGGTRTYHRLTCAVEDAGFEIRDEIAWLYGSGFPKSLNVSKAIDKAAGAEQEVVGPRRRVDGKPPGHSALKLYGGNPDVDLADLVITAPATDDAKRWQGWGTALKPAHEPIVVARKPLAGTVAANVLAHGTGALNIDGCRVESDGSHKRFGMITRRTTVSGDERIGPASGMYGAGSAYVPTNHDGGRWPTNVIMTHAATPDGADACADGCVPGCPVAELDTQSGNVRSAGIYDRGPVNSSGPAAINIDRDGYRTGMYADSGGASRFFPVFRYQAKAPTRERPKADGTAHPTVKPLELMRWLVRLVTPPSGLVLDPFVGSGTTAAAAIAEGARCFAIEQHDAYIPLIQQRLNRRQDGAE